MMNGLLKCICDIVFAFTIVLCGREALEENTNFIYCVMWWFAVYFSLDLHRILINYINENL